MLNNSIINCSQPTDQILLDIELYRYRQQILKHIKPSLKQFLLNNNIYNQYNNSKTILSRFKLSKLLTVENIKNNPEILDCLFMLDENPTIAQVLEAFADYLS